MKITDMIALSKAGFKASEIRQMIEDEQQETEAPEDPEPVGAGEDPDTPSGNDPQPEPEPEQREQEDPEPDYKALYEAEKKKVSELQSNNTRKQQPDAKSDDDIIKDMINNFF